MIYKITPFNILSVIAILIAIYGAIKPGQMGFGLLALVYYLPAGVLGLAFDFVMQRKLDNYKALLAMEFTIIIVAALAFEWTKRSKDLNVSPNRESEYIVFVYGVENAEKLPFRPYYFYYSLDVPENGILLTSTKRKQDFPFTKVYENPDSVNQKKSKIPSVKIKTGTLNCEELKYEYEIWKMDKSGSISYSSIETDSLQQKLEAELCGYLKKIS